VFEKIIDEIEKEMKGVVKEKVDVVDYSDYKKLIDEFLTKEECTESDYTTIFKTFLMKETTQSAKIYFHENGGTKKLTKLLSTSTKPFDLIMLFIRDSFIYQEEFIKADGVNILLSEISLSFEKGKEDSSVYDDVEECFEILISLTE